MAGMQMIFAAAKAGKRNWGNAAFMRRCVASAEAGCQFAFPKMRRRSGVIESGAGLGCGCAVRDLVPGVGVRKAVLRISLHRPIEGGQPESTRAVYRTMKAHFRAIETLARSIEAAEESADAWIQSNGASVRSMPAAVQSAQTRTK